MNLDATAFIKPSDLEDVYVELRDLALDHPWASVRMGRLTLLCEAGTSAIFQKIADEIRKIEKKPEPIPFETHTAAIATTDHVECEQP